MTAGRGSNEDRDRSSAQDGSMLDEETATSGRNSGLAPSEDDDAQ